MVKKVIRINDFYEKMLLIFPELKMEYKNKTEEFCCGVDDTLIIEDVFMPTIVALLRKDANIEVLKTVFNFFEQVSNYADEYLLTTFSVAVLEILGNDREILSAAKKYMYSSTRKLQKEADEAIGREQESYN